MSPRALLLLVLLCAACRPLVPPAGPAPAAAPTSYLLDEAALPDYERTLDHAGLMATGTRSSTTRAW
jgi:hypothetical protein